MKKILTLIALIMATLSSESRASELTNACSTFLKSHLIDISPRYGTCTFSRRISGKEVRAILYACEQSDREPQFIPLMIGPLESPKIQVRCRRERQ